LISLTKRWHALCFAEVTAAQEPSLCVIFRQRALSRDQGARVKLAASRELHSYWNLLRGERSAPERSEIDPSAIRGVLADTFILEVDRFRRYPIRISGTRTNSLFARELKGGAFLDLWRRADQPELAAILASVTDEAVAVLAGVSTHSQGRQPLGLELLLLPLRHRGNMQARILGAFSPACLPSWIGLLPAAPMTLLSLRVLGAPESPPRNRLSPARAQPGEAADFGRTPHVGRRGHLYVVTSAAQQR
jgi:hypothetical protein